MEQIITIYNGRKSVITFFNQEDDPSWSVDLGGELYVFEIKIVSRKDCCFTLPKKLNIFLGSKENGTKVNCRSFNLYNDQSQRLLFCEPTKKTSLLTIGTEGSKEKLALCEVFVYATG